jgi:ATP-dependent DNA helicase RecG
MPSPIEKLIKFFKLEINRNYDNRAVVGGLEKIVPMWENEARADQIDPQVIQFVSERLNRYAAGDLPERTTLIQELLNLLMPLITAQPIRQAPQPISASVPAGFTNKPVESARHTPAHKPGISPIPENAAPQGLGAPLTVIHGIGPKNAETLAEVGLHTLGDMLYYFPRRYDDYSKLKAINNIFFGEELTILGTVHSIQNRTTHSGRMQVTECILGDGTGFLRLTWFNQPWIATKLKPKDQLVVSGKVDMWLGRLVMKGPEWEPLEQDHLHTNRIVPVYPLSGSVTQRWLRRMLYQTVTFWAPRMPDFLPDNTRLDAGLIDLSTALLNIHFPESVEMLNKARLRLAFDEIFLLQLGVMRQKLAWESVIAQKFETPQDWLNAQISRLPYILTNAQQRVVADLHTDLGSGRPMNRLLQGDVGSGKTAVAAMAIAMICVQGAQAAVMAPTSILADQHFTTLRLLLANGSQESPSVLQENQVRLLVGDTSESDKKEIRSGLEDGSIKLIIGTHALIEDPVIFQRLQLLVVDEQHRFGVAQRSALRAKGENPHLLVMTATPIPRSLALTVYGDLDISVMDEMPVGRLPIETHVLHPLERERAYELINSQVEKGHQAFIIYPLIDKGENDEAKAAVDDHRRLQADIVPRLKLGLLHGKLRPEEKDQVMGDFRARKYDILVSTSVVEVGVDVPNATVMLVEGANRFGLAQLHQFRGRVGRAEDQSYCLLIPETEDSVENERLAVMAQTNNGFFLAEKDLEQRGPGEFLGTRQSGYSGLKMASLTDVHLIEKARTQAQRLFANDPNLSSPAHERLEKMMRRFWEGGQGDIS